MRFYCVVRVPPLTFILWAAHVHIAPAYGSILQVATLAVSTSPLLLVAHEDVLLAQIMFRQVLLAKGECDLMVFL